MNRRPLFLLTPVLLLLAAPASAQDTTPPAITGHVARHEGGRTIIELRFSEPVNTTQAANVGNYQFWYDIYPQSNAMDAVAFPDRVVLRYSILMYNDPPDASYWWVRVTGIEDLAGNPMGDTEYLTNYPLVNLLNPELALALGPAGPDACTTGADIDSAACWGYATAGDLGTGYHAYVVALSDRSTSLFAGASFAVEYGPDLYFGAGSVCTNFHFDQGGFPSSGGGRTYAWSPTYTCTGTPRSDGGASSVLGAFYVYAYAEETLALVPRAFLPSNDMVVTACIGETPVSPSGAGFLRFTAGATEDGCTPCLGPCELPSVGIPEGETPGLLTLSPNPMRGAASLEFSLDHPGPVRIRIHDVAGRLVRDLVDERLDAGAHRETWDGRDEGGRPAPAGVYLVRLETPSGAETRRLVRLAP